MKLLLAIIAIALFPLLSISQNRKKVKRVTYDLVANGSFEDINSCTEFDARCEPEGWFFLPNYTEEPQGNDSNRYELLTVGNIKYGGSWGNYIYTRLLCPLVAGSRYQFSIWVVPIKNEFEHLDVYFSYQEPRNHAALRSINEVSFSLTPQQAKPGRYLWKKYSYTYTANGEERFVSIGNFSNQPLDKSKTVANNKRGDVLYGIDNISLLPLENREPFCPDYYARLKQVYEQDRRHPPRLKDDAPLDSSLFIPPPPNWVTTTVASKKNTASQNESHADTLIIPDILFASNSSTIKPAFIGKLQSILTNIRISQPQAIEVAGHTDNIGSTEDNNKLSLKRAEAIRQYIISQLPLTANIITAKGIGEAQAIADNSTPEGRQKNRRVEIILKK